MTCRLVNLCIDANDPLALARFWSGVLGWELAHDLADVALVPNDDTGFKIRFLPTNEQKTVPNQMHFDLTSTSLEDQHRTVTRALELGAHHLDVGQRPEEGHVVLADPEGNELCVIGPGNQFLADCGFIGALASEGSREVGYFWSHALAWPLVWNQGEETAIRSPHGGPKITWAEDRSRRRPESTDGISTSRRPMTMANRARSSASFHWGRHSSTSASATCVGWGWPIPTAMSSACCHRRNAERVQRLE